MIPAELLRKKRDGYVFDAAEIEQFVEGIVAGTITAAQAAAFLMASCIRGLNRQETVALTHAMVRSGHCFNWQHLGYAVDKHSTGGVGDKLSLLVAPIAAAAGALVPMMSGRGLGHTGGTVDKLESIVGFRVQLSDEQIETQLRTLGVVMIAQSERLVPADRILYALRDETGTVESVGLITASILSKKIAEGAQGLVLDVKSGRGAFMQRYAEAKMLANSLAEVGTSAGLNLHVFITDMDDPLGWSAGNWVEVLEAERALADPAQCTEEIRELTLVQSGAMLQLAGIASTIEEGIERARLVWQNGTAYEYFHRLVAAQGGNWRASVEQYQHVPSVSVVAPQPGYIAGFATRDIGLLLVELGAGRRRASDTVDSAAGITFHIKRGSQVEKGQPLATLYASNRAVIERCSVLLLQYIEFSEQPVERKTSAIIDIVQ